MKLLEAALNYLDRGFSVIPVRPDKRPFIKWEPYQRRKATREEVKAWWTKWPSAMIGIVTGSISGVAVVDVDDPDQGMQALSEYLTGCRVPTVTTPGGGYHFWFKAPEKCPGNATGTPPGVDFRGEGGYIVAPPSQNGTGRGYQWKNGLSLDNIEPPPLPERYIEFIGSSSAEKTKPLNWREDIFQEGVKEGERNDTLMKLSASYLGKGLAEAEILTLLFNTNSRFDPPLPEKEVRTILTSMSKKHRQNHIGQDRNFTEEIRAWVANAYGKFTNEQIYKDLGLITSKEKTHVRVELHRMVERGIIERGSINGTFLKIEVESDEMQIKNEIPSPLPLALPGNVHRHVAIYHKNLLVGAGSSNGGKTAYALNCAYENRTKFDVHYFTTEMDSDELTLRIHNFGYPLNEWSKIKFKAWTSYHSIQPDSLNILDYLEVKEGEFWKVGDDLRRIFDRLKAGIAFVFIQMDRGARFGWGGQKTIDRARLYFTLDDNKLTIIKGKNWAGNDNPNGKSITFKLYNGARFEWGHWA